jgi:hypothetical protein
VQTLTENRMSDWDRLKDGTSLAVVVAAAGIVTVITALYLIFGG